MVETDEVNGGLIQTCFTHWRFEDRTWMNPRTGHAVGQQAVQRTLHARKIGPLDEPDAVNQVWGIAPDSPVDGTRTCRYLMRINPKVITRPRIH